MSNKDTEEFTPRKKKALVTYLLIIFSVAFLLVAISMFVRNRTMQEEFDASSSEAHESYAALESSVFAEASENENAYEKALTAMERKAYASELLALAEHAYHEGNRRDFQGYMASLEGYTDALSQDMLEIYEELETALRGN